MREVKLKIKGVQVDIHNEESITEITTEGKYYIKNEAKYYIYDESEVSGMENSTTTLKVQENKITMIRRGGNDSKLVFEKGKRYKTGYLTPYGVLDLELLTDKLEIDTVDSGKGHLKLEYRLNISGIEETKNYLSIDII